MDIESDDGNEDVGADDDEGMDVSPVPDDEEGAEEVDYADVDLDQYEASFMCDSSFCVFFSN
jgi:hypothetical protein